MLILRIRTYVNGTTANVWLCDRSPVGATECLLEGCVPIKQAHKLAVLLGITVEEENSPLEEASDAKIQSTSDLQNRPDGRSQESPRKESQ